MDKKKIKDYLVRSFRIIGDRWESLLAWNDLRKQKALAVRAEKLRVLEEEFNARLPLQEDAARAKGVGKGNLLRAKQAIKNRKAGLKIQKARTKLDNKQRAQKLKKDAAEQKSKHAAQIAAERLVKEKERHEAELFQIRNSPVQTADSQSRHDDKFRKSWWGANFIYSIITVAIITVLLFIAYKLLSALAGYLTSFSVFAEVDAILITVLKWVVIFVVAIIVWALLPEPDEDNDDSGSRRLIRTISPGRQGAVYIFGRQMPGRLSNGPVLWLGSVVQVSLNTLTTIFPKPGTDSEGVLVQIQVGNNKETGMPIMGNFFVKIQISWSVVSARNMARFLEIGKDDMIIDWSTDGEKSPRTKVERTYFVGEGLQLLRTYFATRNYFIDICGIDLTGRPVVTDTTQSIQVLDQVKKAEMLRLLNDKMAECGASASDIFAEKVIPADEATRIAISGAVAEVGEQAKELKDTQTLEMITAQLLARMGLTPDDVKNNTPNLQAKLGTQTAASFMERMTALAMVQQGKGDQIAPLYRSDRMWDTLAQIAATIGPALVGLITGARSAPTGPAPQFTPEQLEAIIKLIGQPPAATPPANP